MRRVKPSTQAMFELQQMLNSLTSGLVLQRTERFWQLWYAGEDFNKSEAEIAELEELEPGYYQSYCYGDIKIDPKGAIRSFEFTGSRPYAGRSVLEQLIVLTNDLDTGYSYVTDMRVDLRPNGHLIDVDVIAIEEHFVHDGSVEPVAKQFTQIVGRFAFDAEQNLLLHRA